MVLLKHHLEEQHQIQQGLYEQRAANAQLQALLIQAQKQALDSKHAA